MTTATFRPNPQIDGILADSVRPRLLETAEAIAADVTSSTSSSKYLSPYGERMFVEETETGARVGTTWGPAVPIEFGSLHTAPKRILCSIAERFGRWKPS